MNDYQEIIIGEFLLEKTYNTLNAGKKLREFIKKIDPNLSTDLVFNYNRVRHNLNKTYAFCLTEEMANDKYGRLSIWRAYVPKNGVALILNIETFIKETNKTRAFTMPMFYYDLDEFAEKFEVFANNLEEYLNKVNNIDEFEESKFLHNKFLITVLSLKHKGFEEEKEWRILYNDEIYPADNFVKEKIEILNGVPRIVKILNFEALNDDTYYTKLNDVLHKIIIGPSDNPKQLQEIFIKKLVENGVNNAESKVIISEIPVRI